MGCQLAKQLGQVKDCHEQHPTEEGWTAISISYEKTEDGVRAWVRDYGRDCDGLLCVETEYIGTVDDDGYITWEEVGGHQYDEYAAKAGY
jgi:hypothetical protein